METPLRNSGLFWFLDPVAPTADAASGPFRLGATRGWTIPLFLSAALLALSVVGWFVDPARFYFAYLVGWLFCVALAVGALFFVMAHHITRAHWAVTVRRIAEVVAMSFPLLLLLSVPVFVGLLSGELFHWTHHELYDPASPEYDPLLAGKQSWLNVPFFVGRVLLYFAAWIVLATKLYRLSVAQDVAPDRDIPARQRKVSAWGIPLYAVTVAFAGFDLLMSLDPHWFSTIFGVYFFAGAYWSGVAFITFLAALLQRNGALGEAVSKNHYLDLGRWMFAFTVFWAYIAFSQYMLIWYGNLKEETIWFTHRLEHGWGWHSALLLALHFVAPFLLLLPQGVKRSSRYLAFMAVWFFVMQWFDLHWLALPNLTMRVAEAGGHASTFHWLDLTCWLGLFGLFGSVVWMRLARHPLVPINDPRLPLSINHGHL